MGIRFIKISVVYFVIGVCIGMGMSMTHQFTLTAVHVHINLLGWTAMTLAGILYYLFPKAGASRLGAIHFWLHNIGLPLMMGGLTIQLLSGVDMVSVIAGGGTLVVAGIILFAINIFKYVRASDRDIERTTSA